MDMRVLFASTRSTGHFAPLVPFAQACRDAGHDVLVAGPPEIAESADPGRAGLRARGRRRSGAPGRGEPDDGRPAAPASSASRSRRPSCSWGLHARAALPDMLDLVEHWRPDVIARETAEVASLVAADAHDVPEVRVGIALATPYEDGWLAMASGALDALREEAGVPGDPCAERARRAPVLTQVPVARSTSTRASCPRSCAATAWRRRAPPARRRAGGRTPRRRSCRCPSARSSRSTATTRTSTGGSSTPSPGVSARVLVTVGRHADPAELGALPPNVHVERWVAQASVMPHAAAMVAHGGAGTTLAALAAGVPLVMLPLSADQPLNARPSRAGCGRVARRRPVGRRREARRGRRPRAPGAGLPRGGTPHRRRGRARCRPSRRRPRTSPRSRSSSAPPDLLRIQRRLRGYPARMESGAA